VAHIVGKAQHDLRRSVPSSCNVLSHKALVASGTRCAASGGISTSQSKIADFELAIRVDKKVSGFEITVKNISGVNVL
jgi:hypothetical protein